MSNIRNICYKMIIYILVMTVKKFKHILLM